VQYENNATPVVLLAFVLRVFTQGVRASHHVTLFPLRDAFKEKDILFQIFFFLPLNLINHPKSVSKE